MKKLIITTLIASSSLLASNIDIDSIGVKIGISSSDYNQKNNQGTIILGNEPDKSFNSLELYLTLNPMLDMYKEYNMKPYISLTHSRNSELKHQYLLVGVNKYYIHSILSLKFYAGLVGGYGQMGWSTLFKEFFFKVVGCFNTSYP